MACTLPDPNLGTALRFYNYLECNTELLGREGFLALAGFGVSSGLVTSLVTISLTLIGYRIIMGYNYEIHDSINWIIKVGAIFALFVSWPIFQVLFYDVVIQGPIDIGNRLLAALGLSNNNIIERIQTAYDVIRLGTTIAPENIITEGEGQTFGSNTQIELAMPTTANTFLLVSLGIGSAIKMAAAFLLSIAPFPILAMLFNPSYGLFIGWLRALVATIFAGASFLIANVLMINVVESEISRIHDINTNLNATISDFQAIGAIVWIFVSIIIILLYLSVRMSASISEITTPLFNTLKYQNRYIEKDTIYNEQIAKTDVATKTTQYTKGLDEGARVSSIVDALNDVVKREKAWNNSNETVSTENSKSSFNAVHSKSRILQPSKVGRRTLGKKHRSAIHRDKLV